MHYSFSTSLICIAALGSSLVQAGPQQARSVKLNNGHRVVDASVENLAKSSHVKRCEQQPETNCDGSHFCYESWMSNDGDGACKTAQGFIEPDKLYHTRDGSEETGVCARNCGIFVKGDDCDLSGEEMEKGVADIQDSGCEKCGTKTYEDGCMLVMDYVTGCSPHGED